MAYQQNTQHRQQNYSGYQSPMLNAQGLPVPPATYVENSYPNGYYAPSQQQGYPGNNNNFDVLKPGFQILNDQSGIFIKQKVEWIEAITGCETENKYNVFSLGTDNDHNDQKLFKCKEKSDWCSRNCLNGSCRPFKMNISTVVSGSDDDHHEPFLEIERPCQCTFLCFNRPEIRVTLVENGKSEYLGKIVDPFTICSMQLDIFDQNEQIKYKIDGSCLQLGILCKFPCEPCETVEFDVLVPSSGEKVSALQKKSKGCLKSAVSDADNFALVFPHGASDKDKAMLMCAVLFLDFRHFEESKKATDNIPAL